MIYVLLFVLGSCIGSFVNVMLSRNDWYTGRSRCDNCGYVLKFYDLIPMISFLMLRGRCRNCKKKIDKAHFVSEVFMGTAFLVSSLSFSTNGVYLGLLSSVVLFFLTLAAIEDYKEQMVYSWILNAGIITAAVVKCVGLIAAGKNSELIAVIGLTITSKAAAYFISKLIREKIGSGDFDAFIMILLLVGWYGLLICVTNACVIGCIVYIPLIVLKKRTKEEPIPLIPLLLAGTMCYLIV